MTLVGAAAVLVTHADDRAAREALAVTAPLVESLAELGRQVDGAARPLILWCGWAAVAALGMTALRREVPLWRALIDDRYAAGVPARPLRIGPQRRNYFWWVDVAVQDLTGRASPE